MVRPVVVYLLSSAFEYGSTISPASGETYAQNYDWPTLHFANRANLAEVVNIVIIDNRFLAEEINELEPYLCDLTGRGIRVLLKLHDPYVEEQAGTPWVRLVERMLDKPNVHLLTVYQPSEITSLLFAKAVVSRFVHAPYTYDETRELNVPESERRRLIFFSGNAGPKYPLRQRFLYARSVNPLIRLWSRTLKHPGYPDIGQNQLHTVVGDSYIEYLARYKYCFVCSSRCRLELQRYREIGYAGAVPIGDIPATLIDMPRECYFSWSSLATLPKTLLLDVDWQHRASSYRAFLRARRGKVMMKTIVSARLASLL